MPVAEVSYATKPDWYFLGIRRDYVSELPVNPAANILEIGCSDGRTGEYAISERKCGVYCGVELFSEAAEKAKERITEVLTGDVETLRLPWKPEIFDAVILSEVLEHLVDPWSVLRKIRPLLKPGALVFASCPNVSHYKIVLMLLRGEWTLTDSLVMDRTHLRWFTPKSFRQMFEECGYTVTSVSPLGELDWRGKLLSFLAFGYLDTLLTGQINLKARA